MTTDPANAPASVNTTGPTREEIIRAISGNGASYATVDRIIALYAPALARLERERDEARADYERVVNVGAKLIDDIARIDIERATAHAKGMRKAAGIVREIAERHRDGAHNCHMEDLRDAAQLASYAARSIDDVEAAILAAIPK